MGVALVLLLGLVVFGVWLYGLRNGPEPESDAPSATDLAHYLAQGRWPSVAPVTAGWVGWQTPTALYQATTALGGVKWTATDQGMWTVQTSGLQFLGRTHTLQIPWETMLAISAMPWGILVHSTLWTQPLGFGVTNHVAPLANLLTAVRLGELVPTWDAERGQWDAVRAAELT